MTFVGRGGTFMQETSYKYVGHGRGDFRPIQTQRPSSLNACFCVGLALALALLLLIVVVIWIPRPPTTTTTPLTTTRFGYDCTAGYLDWQSLWSVDKQNFCCEHSGRACQTTSRSSTTLPPRPYVYDCRAGEQNWQAGWSVSKKAYCCTHAGTGCPEQPTTSAPYDCEAGFWNWQKGWSDGKKVWCCQNERRGCAVVAASSCLIWGDPHIDTFDHSRADFYGEGIVWLVKSSQVHIQARYKATPFTNGLAATNAIAIGGPFLGGHVLKVGAMEDGQITWDNNPILTDFPSQFTMPGFGEVVYNGDGNLVDEAQSHLERHIVHVNLREVHVQVMRWNNHINVRITMKQISGQDGHCGNFNMIADDDTTEQITLRMGPMPQSESLFRNYVAPSPGKLLTVDDCPPHKQADAGQTCKTTQPNMRPEILHACIFDVCFAGKQYAEQDGVY